MMRYFYDCEFIEDGRTIDLVSIGIVAEDGREYYAQSVEFDVDRASQWVKDNVLMHLPLCSSIPTYGLYSLGTVYGAMSRHAEGQCTFDNCPWRTREQIKQEVLSFMDIERYGTPELWGYYSSYDHVAFAQLFGTMMDLPKGYPMYTRDLKQWCDMLGNPQLPEQGEGEHNALADARWNRQVWEFLQVATIQKMRKE